MPLPKPQPAVFPKVKPAVVVPPPVLPQQQALRQFATKPVVAPLKQGRINKIIQPVKSPLKPPKIAKAPAVKVVPANPLNPLKSYLP